MLPIYSRLKTQAQLYIKNDDLKKKAVSDIDEKMKKLFSRLSTARY